MLRGHDLLLTFAAAFLLVAAVNRRSYFHQASASSLQQNQLANINKNQDNENLQEHQQTVDRVDRLMSKIKQNTLRPKAHQGSQMLVKPNQNTNLDLKGDINLDHSKQNSYHHFANEMVSINHLNQLDANNQTTRSYQVSTTNHNNDNHNQNYNGYNKHHAEPQEVRVESLRTADNPYNNLKSNHQKHAISTSHEKNQKIAKNKQQPNQNMSQTLYMLNMPVVVSPMDASRLVMDNEVAEQQQHQEQPFNGLAAMLPQFNQLNPVQQQQFINQLTPEQQANVRQILAQYGGPAGLQATPANNPRLNAGLNMQVQQNLTATPKAGTQNQYELPGVRQNHRQPQQQLVNPLTQLFGMTHENPRANQQQQPMNALQFLTAPFQAFLPQLNPQNQQPQQLNKNPRGLVNNNNNNNSNNNNRNPNASRQYQRGNNKPIANPLLPTTNSQQPQQQQQNQQLPNLQTLYQQLPLYQALLAARQRQEALQAAEKLRQAQLQQQQHQQQQPPQHLSNQLGLLNQLQNQQQTPLQPVIQWGNNPTQHQQNQKHQLVQPTLGPVVVSPNANAALNNNNQQQNNQPNPNTGHVQFDDDEPQNQGNNNNNDNNDSNASSKPTSTGTNDEANSNNNNESEQQNNNNSNENNDDNKNNNNSNDNNNDNGNQAEPEIEPDNHNNAGGGQSGGSSGEEGGAGGLAGDGKPEEEDADLKQFQNFANGGDSFTDLFPKGVLDNNDITEINDEQKKQNKRQEEQERQKQLQQNQQQPQNQNQQQPNLVNNQQNNYQPPVDQSVNNNDNNNNDVNNNAQNQNNSAGNDQQQDQVNNNGNDDRNQPADNESNGQDEPEDGGEGGGAEGKPGEGEDQGDETPPEAAALTSKSSASSNAIKLTSSPGVVYSRA